MTKHIDQSLIDQILNSPQAPVYIEALKAKTGEIESQAIAQFKIPIQAIFDKAHNFEVLKSMRSS